jgi:hypothetical protein
LQLLLGLAEIDDVDAVARVKDERLHLGIPALGLMAEMDAGVQQFLNSDGAHFTQFSVGFTANPTGGTQHPAEHRILVGCCYGFHRRGTSAMTASHEAETVFPAAEPGDEERPAYQKNPLPQ